MTNLLRSAGIGLIVFGVVLIAVWAVEPLRMIWPWIRGLPLPIRVGVIAAVIGFSVLLGSLIAERVRDGKADQELRDELDQP